MANLKTIYHSVASFNSVVGCPILIDTANSDPGVSVASGTPATVLTIATGADLAGNPFDFLPDYPLILKLFFTKVVMSGVVAYPNPEFIVTISGSTDFKCHLVDEKDFALAIKIKDWYTRPLTTVVSILPLPTLTGVTCKCLAGIALDNQNRAEEY